VTVLDLVKTTLVALGYTVAAVLIILGADQVYHDVYRSLHYDGGMAFDATGKPVVPRFGPIRLGKVEVDWLGPAEEEHAQPASRSGSLGQVSPEGF
jgi:hypothetical protein